MGSAGRAFIGTSGWRYAAWRAGFYAGRPEADWLAFCAERFTSLEINATHYRLQSDATMRRWRAATPPGFRFALKAHRYLTHNRKLAEPLGPIRVEREHAAALGEKLAVVLWQLPAGFKRNLERLAGFARALHVWRRARHAMEFRHPSWFDAGVAQCLRAHRIAVCQSDAADWPLWDEVTTDLVYVRLHGHERTYASSYGDAELHRWARKVRCWTRAGADVHVYFDNDARGHAPLNAARLLAMLPSAAAAARRCARR